MSEIANTLLAQIPVLSGGIWDVEYFGNTLSGYVFAGVVLVGALIVFGVLQFVLLRRLAALAKKTETDIDDALIRIVGSFKPPFYTFLAFYVGVQTLQLNNVFGRVLEIILLVWVIYQVIRAGEILVEYVAIKFFDKDGDGEADAAIALLAKLIRGILWASGGLFILQNLGVNVTALVAGLGVGGIAIAFALQNILEDLFSSFAIHFDKPFVVGDFIVLGDKKGTVERIGIKTTRIRSVQGEELVVSNKELTATQIQNFGAMEERRINFVFGLIYDTPVEKLRRVPGIVKGIVGGIAGARFDRCFFKNFADSALEFDTVYYVESSDYKDYIRANEAIYLMILEKFAAEGIEMAFPTQTIHVVKDQSNANPVSGNDRI